MSNTTPINAETSSRAILEIGCKLFGHKYRITKRYASNLKEFECAQCKRQFTLDGYGHYTPLTPKLKKSNEIFENFYSKKRLVG